MCGATVKWMMQADAIIICVVPICFLIHFNSQLFDKR
jgi:hypothetical protein